MSHRWLRRLLFAGLLLVLVLGSTYVFRDPIAKAMFAGFTSLAPGMDCSHPDIHVDRSLTRMELESLECTLVRGVVHTISTASPTVIELHGLQPPVVWMAQATIDKRERDVSNVETNTLGDLGKLVGMTDPQVKAMLDEADSYSLHQPEIRIERLTALRGGKRENVMIRFRHWVDGEAMRTHAARVEIGGAPVDLRDLDMSVTPAHGELAIAVFLGKAERGERADTTLKIVGRGLGKQKPSFDLSLHSGDQRTARAK
jgi:hypothetical protein